MTGWRTIVLQAAAWVMVGLLALLPLLFHAPAALSALFSEQNDPLVVVTDPAMQRLSRQQRRDALAMYAGGLILRGHLTSQTQTSREPICQWVAPPDATSAAHQYIGPFNHGAIICTQQLERGWTALRPEIRDGANTAVMQDIPGDQDEHILVTVTSSPQVHEETVYRVKASTFGSNRSGGERPLAYVYADQPAVLTVVTPAAPSRTPTVTPTPTMRVTASPASGAGSLTATMSATSPMTSVPTPTATHTISPPIHAHPASEREVRDCLGPLLYGTVMVVFSLARLSVVTLACLAASLTGNLIALRFLLPMVKLFPKATQDGARHTALALLAVADAIGLLAFARWAVADALHPIPAAPGTCT